MNVLVIIGSKHGATQEIGAAIAKQLNTAGHHATAIDAENPAGELDLYDAFVIGSAIYMGTGRKTPGASLRTIRTYWRPNRFGFFPVDRLGT
jgi:menaquinone-dependent protoporphyrinogen IX oxidase